MQSSFYVIFSEQSSRVWEYVNHKHFNVSSTNDTNIKCKDIYKHFIIFLCNYNLFIRIHLLIYILQLLYIFILTKYIIMYTIKYY